MDLDQAVEVAAKEKRPILLNFSGSDWCGWCKLMEERVFSQPEWKSYAEEHLVMVLIDFPQDASRVPEAYVSRNQQLSEQYGVEGFPTFIVLDDDGKTVLGQLQAGQEKTPASFRAELERLFRNRPAALEAYLASLDDASKEIFKGLMGGLASKKADLEKAEAEAMAAQQRIGSLQEEIIELELQLKAFRVAQLGEEKLAEFEALQAEHAAKMKELNDWFATEPEENEENVAKFEEMSQAIMEIMAKLEAF